MKWFGASAGSATSRHLLQKAAKVGILIVVSPVPAWPALGRRRLRRRTASPTRSPPRRHARRRCVATSTSRTGCWATSRVTRPTRGARSPRPARSSTASTPTRRRCARRSSTRPRPCAKVQARRQALQDELQQLDQTLDLLEQEIAQGAAELDARREALGARLADAYRTQNTSLLEQVLDSGSFTDVLSDASAYLAYGDQDAQMAQPDRGRPGVARLAACRHRRHPLSDRPAPARGAGLRGRPAGAEAGARRGQGPLPQAGEADQSHPATAAGQGAPDRGQPAPGRAYIRRQPGRRAQARDRKVAGLLRAAKRKRGPECPQRRLGWRQRQRSVRVAGGRAS